MKIKELIDNPVNLNRPEGISDAQWVKALELYQAAKNVGDKFPELTVAQAALETGWFKKESGKNNFFGQKASSSQKGSVFSTHEVIGGNRKAIKSKFRDYESLESSLLDRKNKWMSKYADASTAQEAIGKIWRYDENKKQGVGYATDPQYGKKINTILSMMGVENAPTPEIDKPESKETKIDNTAVAKKQFIPIGTDSKNATYAEVPDISKKDKVENTTSGITEEKLREILSTERKNTESRFLDAFKQQSSNQNQEVSYEVPQEDLSYLYDYINIDTYANGGEQGCGGPGQPPCNEDFYEEVRNSRAGEITYVTGEQGKYSFHNEPQYEGHEPSTHLMSDDNKNQAWPAIRYSEGKWQNQSQEQAKANDEIYSFENEEELFNFARKGSWKKFSKGGKYIVKKGDSLSKIAKENNLSLDEILEMNSGYKENPNALNLGDEITLNTPKNASNYALKNSEVYAQLKKKDNIYSPQPFFQNINYEEILKPVEEPTVFDPEGDGYDYATAKQYGIEPNEDGHWPSRVKETGQILKGQSHKTYNKTVEGEKKAGYKISKGDDGKYYSKVFGKDSIVELQKTLVDAGYDIGKTGEKKDGVDGILGVKTKRAQKKYNESLNLKNRKKFTSINLGELKNKEEIKRVQKVLYYSGYNIGDSKEEAIDGKLGKKTKKAIEEYKNRSPEKNKAKEKDIIDKTQNIIPLSVRQFVYDSFGGEETLNETDVSSRDLLALKEVVIKNINKDKFKVDYNDWREANGTSKDTRDEDMNLLNSYSSLQKTLGQASIKIDDKGDVYVEDEYNFNDAGGEENRYKNKFTDKEGLLPVSRDNSVSNNIYRIARNYKTKYGNKEGGSPVNIYIGNVSDFF